MNGGTFEMIIQKRISNEEQFLLIKLPKEGIMHYTDYNEQLRHLLRSDIIQGFSSCRGRLRLKIVDKYNRIQQVLFHHFVYCFYHRNMNKDNVFDVLEQFRKELHESGKCVAHLDCDKWNHCKDNLSVITKKEEAQRRRYYKYEESAVTMYEV
jgi:hypothetical protein